MKISCSQVVKTNEGVWKMDSVKIWQAASYLAALHATYPAGIWPFIELFKSRHRLLEGPNRSARPLPQRIPSTPQQYGRYKHHNGSKMTRIDIYGTFGVYTYLLVIFIYVLF